MFEQSERFVEDQRRCKSEGVPGTKHDTGNWLPLSLLGLMFEKPTKLGAKGPCRLDHNTANISKRERNTENQTLKATPANKHF
eukprot:4643317-Amphidinium_carterae.1